MHLLKIPKILSSLISIINKSNKIKILIHNIKLILTLKIKSYNKIHKIMNNKIKKLIIQYL